MSAASGDDGKRAGGEPQDGDKPHAGSELHDDVDSASQAGALEAPEAVGALVLFSSRLDECVGFYRALGLPLAGERHGDGPMHHTCDLGGTHFALFDAEVAAEEVVGGAAGASFTGPVVLPPEHPRSQGRALTHRSAGSSFFGLTVRDLDAIARRVRALGLSIRQEPTQYSWGRRMLVDDPDARVVELFERPS